MKKNITKNIVNSLSIIVPLFNEQDTVLLFYCELARHLPADLCCEIIFVDDGSDDKGLDIIEGIASKDSRIKYISLQQNYGQQAAIYCGLKFASGNAVIIMDCDLQDPPFLIPAMIRMWRNGAKIVLPLRQSRQDRWHKRTTAKLFYTALNLHRKSKLNPAVGEFYLLDKTARDQLLKELCHPLFLRGSVQRLTLQKHFLPYNREARRAGKTSYNLGKMIRLARDAYASNSQKQIKLDDFKIAESNIFQDKSVAIIGAGVTGLISALCLARLGIKVSLYEKENQIGGLLTSELIRGKRFDRYYHHIFKNDRDFLDLIDSIGLESRLYWHASRVGALINNHLYAINSLGDLLRLPVMSMSAKLRMLLGGYRLSELSFPLCFMSFQRRRESTEKRLMDTSSAKSVIEKYMGQAAWNRFWRPMFESKFAAFSNQISAAWFVARLKARVSSRHCGREILGYPEGGFDPIIHALKKEITARGGKIFTGIEVTKVATKSHRFQLQCAQPCPSVDLHSTPSFDLCISTLPPHLAAKMFPTYKSPPIAYLGFIGVIVVLKKPFSPHYWINVLDRDAPFGVIVEQNNLSPLSLRKTHGMSLRAIRLCAKARQSLHNKDCFVPRNDTAPHILYLGKYIDTTSDFYNLPDKKIAEIARDWLEKIKPKVKKDLIEIKIFRDPSAQPIVTTKYKKPPYVCDINGFYTTSMAHIYPTDRGLNEVVKEADIIRDLIISNLKS